MSAERRSTLDRVALAVAAVSVVALALEFAWPHDLVEPALVTEQAAAVTDESGVEALPVGPLLDYSSVSERPLFTVDRQPFVPHVEAAAPQPVGPRAEFQLIAVVITGTTQIALLRSNLTPTVQRVALNQSIDGWTLAEIRPDSAVLQRNAEVVRVELRPDPTGTRAAQGVRVPTLASGH